VLVQEILEDRRDDWDVIDGDLNMSTLDRLEDRFCKLGEEGGLVRCFGVDNGDDDTVEEALSQPTQPLGNLSASAWFGKSLCSQK
jgi:hypothetical protein